MNFTEEEKEIVANENIKLVHYVCKSFRNLQLDETEIKSAALLGFAIALNKYDKTNGAKFSTFACKKMQFEIIRLDTRRKAKKRYNGQPESSLEYEIQGKDRKVKLVDALVFENSDYNCIEFMSDIERIEFSDAEYKVLQGMIKGDLQREIADEIGISKTYVGVLMRKIKAKLQEELG